MSERLTKQRIDVRVRYPRDTIDVLSDLVQRTLLAEVAVRRRRPEERESKVGLCVSDIAVRGVRSALTSAARGALAQVIIRRPTHTAAV